MAQTSLVKRLDKTIVRLPAIVVEESGVVLTQYRGGLSKSTSGQNRIEGDFGADTNPKPFQMRGDSPTGLIELIDRTATDSPVKLFIRRFRLLAQPCQRSAQCAAADSQPITPFQNLSRTLVRDTHLLYQVRR